MADYPTPRVLLAGTSSGCGKTTLTCALLQALVDRGLAVSSCKCGPDYIDPMFHSRVIGAKSTNLDPFFFDPDTLRSLLVKNAGGSALTVIEGVMGYYDGTGAADPRASSYEVARITDSPVVLVVGAAGTSLSALAVIQAGGGPERALTPHCPQGLPVEWIQAEDPFQEGISIAKEIVQRHHGTIALAPHEGPGTTIRLTLPIGGPSGTAT